MVAILAQGGAAGTIGHWAMLIILIAAIVGVVFVITRACGVSIPEWVVHVFWILLAAFVGILAIKFLLTISW